MIGIYIPTITPFKNERVDWNVNENYLHFMCKKKINGLVVAGSTGEGIKLSLYEEIELLKQTYQIANSYGKKIIAGISPASLTQAKEMIDKLYFSGLEGFLVLTPFYYGVSTSQSELYDFYIELAEFSPAPIWIYNMPKYTHFEIDEKIVLSLSQHENIMGIKYSGNNLSLLLNLIKICDEQFEVISGNGSVFPEFFKKGGNRAILAIANVMPDLAIKIYKEKDRLDRIQEDVEKIKNANSLIVGKYGVEGLKYILSKILLMELGLRKPFKALSAIARKELDAWYDTYQVEIL